MNKGGFADECDARTKSDDQAAGSAAVIIVNTSS